MVTCLVWGSGKCGLPSFNIVTMQVDPTVGVIVPGGVKSEIRLIPNPNNGQFVISGSLATLADEVVSLEITDILGQVVYSNRVQVSKGSINERVQLANTLANGMYMLNVSTTSERKVLHFVLKQ